MASEGGTEVRIVDFGIAGLCYNNELLTDKSTAGSLKYMAPEILTGQKTAADPAIDIWSMGCILYYLVIGTHPFNAPDRIKMEKKITQGEMKFPSSPLLSQECILLIQGMLKRDFNERFTMNEIEDHPWMQRFA